MPQTEGVPRDRRVVVIVGALVVAVLAIGVISAFVPGMDGAFASVPIVVLVLVVGTVLVLARTIRR